MEFLLFIVALVGWVQLSSRVSYLEKKINRLNKFKDEIIPDNSLQPIPLAGEFPFVPNNMAVNEAGMSAEINSETSFDKFVDWVKQDFMVKLGSFLLLLALGWFVSYAFANNWIGAIGRITLGILVGVLFLVLGTLRMRKYVHQGGIFTVVGATTILLTLYAAREIYDFFTPESALVLMFMTVAFVAFVSVQFNSEKLALAGLIMGGVAPLLTAANDWDVATVFPYLLVLVAGTLWTVWHTGWTRLTLTALIISFLHSLPFLFGDVYDEDIAIMFSFLLVAIFFVANVISLVRRRGEEKHLAIHASTALFTAIFLFSWIETAAINEWKSLLYTAWALVFALGTYVVFVATANYRAFYLYGGTSIALLGVATAAEFDGPVLVLMYLFEISALVFAAAKLKIRTDILVRLSWLLFVPIILSLESLDSWRWVGVFNENFVVLLMSAAILTAVSLTINSRVGDDESGMAKLTVGTFLFGGVFYVMAIVWLVAHQLFNYDLGTMLALVVYTVVGIATFVTGKTHSVKAMRYLGGFLIGAVIARLLLVEVWNMETEGRIITFVIIGLLLISTAFMRKVQLQDNNENQ